MDQVMVQIVENHAEISGDLLSVAPASDRPGFVVMTIKVNAALAVGDWPNLFGAQVGQTVEVLARQGSAVANSKPGSVRLKVKKGGPTTIFAE